MAEPLKDAIDAALVATYVELVAAHDPAAEVGPLHAAAGQLEPLELKDRINAIADALAQALTGPTRIKLATVVAMGHHASFDGLTGWPLASVIERHGLDDPTASLEAMDAVTRQFSCEFAVRPFLTEHLDLTLEHVVDWTTSDSEHPRRLASEGTRPKLPWGPDVPALLADPTIGLGVIERLRHDPSEYVRRSVANHLNDLAKSHPDLIVATVQRWAGEADTDMAMVRHALRTLVKQGRADHQAAAMEILGFTATPEIEVESFAVVPATITLGESIEIAATLRSTAAVEQRIVVDFVIHHVRANGTTSPKVFKWTTPTLPAGATVALTKRRKIATASTRRYHPGHHRVTLQLAGVEVAESGFDLP